MGFASSQTESNQRQQGTQTIGKINSLKRNIQNDTIFVEQTFKFNRTLIVLSGGKQDILFKSDFTDMYESFQFPDLIKSDSVYIIIETLGEEVYKNIFYMNIAWVYF